MSETFNSALVTEKNKIHNLYPWVWLFEADLDGTSGFRAAGHDAAITYGGKTYVAFPISVSGIVRDDKGTLSRPTVTVANVSREVASYLDAGGITDRLVRIYLYNLNVAGYVVEWGDFTVQRAAVTLATASFELGQYALFDVQFPARRQARGRCDDVYGGVECGYNLALSNLISGSNPLFDPTTCDLTPEGSNGCRVHGDNEVAHGQPRQHPRRIGCHPGIPKGPARV